MSADHQQYPVGDGTFLQGLDYAPLWMVFLGRCDYDMLDGRQYSHCSKVFSRSQGERMTFMHEVILRRDSRVTQMVATSQA